MYISEERFRCAQRFFTAARAIGERTADVEAQTCWEYLRAHAYIGEPVANDSDGALTFNLWRPEELGPCKRERPLIVVPMFPEDASIDPTFTLDPRHNAVYYEDGHYVVFRPDNPEVEFLRGCTGLHEAHHAYRAWIEGRACAPTLLTKTEDQERRLLEEADVRFMDTRLWKEHGGAAFRDLLGRVVYRLRKEASWKIGEVRLPSPSRTEDAWLDMLDQLFGPAPNEWARTVRAGTFLICAYFELIEGDSRARKRECRAEAIRSIYAWAGLSI